MTSQRKCPYKACAVEQGWSNCIVQSVFLFLSYLFLTTSSTEFTPFAVILYIAPPLIDLICKKNYDLILKVIKIALLIYSVLILILCTLILNGSFTDNGAYYVISSNTLIYKGFNVEKEKLAYTLVFVVAIPFVLKFSKPEKNDEGFIKGAKKGEKVCH